MKQNRVNKIKGQRSDFNPRIIVGIVAKSDIDSLQELKDFFDSLDGFSLVYFTTSGNPLYITDKKPRKEYSDISKGRK